MSSTLTFLKVVKFSIRWNIYHVRICLQDSEIKLHDRSYAVKVYFVVYYWLESISWHQLASSFLEGTRWYYPQNTCLVCKHHSGIFQLTLSHASLLDVPLLLQQDALMIHAFIVSVILFAVTTGTFAADNDEDVQQRHSQINSDTVRYCIDHFLYAFRHCYLFYFIWSHFDNSPCSRLGQFGEL